MIWLLFAHLADAKKPPPAPAAPPQGWARLDGWSGECWFPPDFTALGSGERKVARQQTLEAMKAQWSGAKDDRVSFDANVIDDVETTLLGRPEKIEAVAIQNLDQCKALRTGQKTPDDWKAWFSSLNRKLMAGECVQPLSYTVFDYLDIGHGWQRPIPLCKGDRAHIIATVKDRYRVTENGDWINVEGVPGQFTTATDMPCSIEGCLFGQLVGRFVTEAGVEMTFPIGADKVFEAPENGTIYYSVNDNTWYDNKWFKSATIEDHTAVTIEPAE